MMRHACNVFASHVKMVLSNEVQFAVLWQSTALRN